jgi:hypothetical protein
VSVLYKEIMYFPLCCIYLKAMIFYQLQPMIVCILVKKYSPSPYMLQYKVASSGLAFTDFKV